MFCPLPAVLRVHHSATMQQSRCQGALHERAANNQAKADRAATEARMIGLFKDLAAGLRAATQQEHDVFTRPKADAAAITAGMNKMRQERMDNMKKREGVIRHPDGRIEQYQEYSVERGSMTEVQTNGQGDFLAAAKTFAVSTMPTPTLMPYKRNDVSDLEATLVDLRRLLDKP